MARVGILSCWFSGLKLGQSFSCLFISGLSKLCNAETFSGGRYIFTFLQYSFLCLGMGPSPQTSSVHWFKVLLVRLNFFDRGSETQSVYWHKQFFFDTPHGFYFALGSYHKKSGCCIERRIIVRSWLEKEAESAFIFCRLQSNKSCSVTARSSKTASISGSSNIATL